MYVCMYICMYVCIIDFFVIIIARTQSYPYGSASMCSQVKKKQLLR